MMPTIRIIGLGQSVAGDDGVGLAVLDELRKRQRPDDVELITVSDAGRLPWMLNGVQTVVIIDAVASSGPPGQVLHLTTDELKDAELHPVSTHGLGIVAAIEMARLLKLTNTELTVHICGITIGKPRQFTTNLSPRVAAAVSVAADLALEWIGGVVCTNHN